ncbi:hypothetical protein [Kribbella sp. CA-247076]|uniref:hypothetical protein n=1 Tax=Kribbella sp. CA-247076 TaxID=3239941 RepID=UPI003D8E8C84
MGDIMGPAIQGYLATSGILSLVGAGIGWLIFNQTATPAPNCVLPGNDVCLEALGMSFLPFVILTAAIGGAIGLGIQYAKGQIG